MTKPCESRQVESRDSCRAAQAFASLSSDTPDDTPARILSSLKSPSTHGPSLLPSSPSSPFFSAAPRFPRNSNSRPSTSAWHQVLLFLRDTSSCPYFVSPRKHRTILPPLPRSPMQRLDRLAPLALELGRFALRHEHTMRRCVRPAADGGAESPGGVHLRGRDVFEELGDVGWVKTDFDEARRSGAGGNGVAAVRVAAQPLQDTDALVDQAGGAKRSVCEQR